MKRIMGLGLALSVVTFAWGAGATVDRGTDVFEIDWIGYHECFGEVVHSVASATYRYQIVQTPKGDYIYTEHWDKHGVEGYVEGLETGTIWLRTDNVSPYVERSTGGGMVMYVFKGTFVSETAPTIVVSEHYHVTYNANGEAVVDRYTLDCKP